MRRARSKKQKRKFKKVVFRLSLKQKTFVDRCAELTNTTPNKLIKTAIKEYLSKHAEMLAEDEKNNKNQLKLFSLEGGTGTQLKIDID